MPTTRTDRDLVREEIRAAWGDDARVHELERSLLREIDTAPGPDDPPQPTDQRPYRSRGPLGRAPVVTADVVLKRAASQIGITEGPTNTSKFGAWYGLDQNPWCAMFVSWCFAMSGMPLPISTPKGFALCDDARDWFKARGRFSQTPTRGSLFLVGDKNGDGNLDHVGLVERVLPDGIIQTIEGNTSNPGGGPDGVFRRTRNAGAPIIGYCAPAYGKAGADAAQDGGGGEPARPAPRRTKLPLLEEGASGVDVRRLQGLLRAAFPALTDNDIALGGDFGPVTADLVRRFQRKQGLADDASVGDDTWAALLGLRRS